MSNIRGIHGFLCTSWVLITTALVTSTKNLDEKSCAMIIMPRGKTIPGTRLGARLAQYCEVYFALRTSNTLFMILSAIQGEDGLRPAICSTI